MCLSAALTSGIAPGKADPDRVLVLQGELVPYSGILTDEIRFRADEAFREECEQGNLRAAEQLASQVHDPIPWLLSGVAFGVLAALTVHGR